MSPRLLNVSDPKWMESVLGTSRLIFNYLHQGRSDFKMDFHQTLAADPGISRLLLLATNTDGIQ